MLKAFLSFVLLFLIFSAIFWATSDSIWKYKKISVWAATVAAATVSTLVLIVYNF